MEFRVEAALPRTARQVWDVMVDIPTIAACIPGCEDIREHVRLADYSAVLRQKLGPFKVALPTTIAVQQVSEPHGIQALASGTDRFTGSQVRVTLRVDVQDTHPGHSHLVAACTMQVVGKLASLGYTVMKKKAEENFAEFQARLVRALHQVPAAEGLPAATEAPTEAPTPTPPPPCLEAVAPVVATGFVPSLP